MTRILFLSASPQDSPLARLEEEVRTIEGRIRLAELRHLFDVKHERALRAKDLQRSLLQHRPEIVHFAGGGNRAGEIVLEDDFGGSRLVSARAVSRVFSILKRESIRCVLMNACYSDIQARAISRHVGCVIGWSGRVSADAAISFAAAFYQALGFGKTLKAAFQLAECQLALDNLEKHAHPMLFQNNVAVNNRRNSAFGSTTSGNMSAKSQRRKRSQPTLDLARFIGTDRFVNIKLTSSPVDRLNSSLLSRLNNGGANERSETARQLGSLRDPASITVLEQRWPLELDPMVRYWLALALGRIGGAGATATLRRLKQTERNSLAQAGLDQGLSHAATHLVNEGE